MKFAHFGEACPGRDRIFCTNPLSHDLDHPIEVEGIDINDYVEGASFAFIDRADVR